MAVFPVAPGHPDYSNTSTTKFIPAIWSGKMQAKFYAASLFPALANTDYAGEIKNQGDEVIIRITPDVTISNYVKGQELAYETLTSSTVSLLIDKGKSFAFSADDIDKKQADINFLEKFSSDAGEQMKVAVDTDILNGIYADANASNKGIVAGAKSGAYNLGTTANSVALTKANILDYLVDMHAVLGEQNLPEQDRYLVLPGWATALLAKSDLKDSAMMGDSTSVLRNGKIGRIMNFDIYTSNNYTAVTDTYSCYNVLFGHKSAITFASQITKVETLRNPKTFGDLVRGLNVYGYKVVQPKSLGVLYCRKG